MKKILLSLVALFCVADIFAVERITIKEFLEKKDTETVYEICGDITSIKNTKYGNFYVNDGTAEVYIYGLGVEAGSLTQNLLTTLGINEGDEIVVQGSYKEYNNSPEIENALYISHVSKGESVDITNTPETAYTTSQASELIAAGKGLTTKVYVKGTITPDGMSFGGENYGNYTYTISDGVKNILVYRGYYFNGDKFTSEDQIQDGDEVVVYGQLTSYKGEDQIGSSSIYSLNGKTSAPVDPYTLVGDGTKENPYTVADVKNLYADSENTPADMVWVKGIVLGNVNTSTGATVVPNVFTDRNGDGILDKNDCQEGETFAVATNLSMGDATGNISVQLPNNEVRAALNLIDHQELIGAEVSVYGNILKYCNVAGVKNTSDYVIADEAGIANIYNKVNDGAIYNVAGQRVGKEYKGIVIINGKKVMK